MSEQETGITEVHKAKKQASVALVGLLVAVAALGGAFWYFDGPAMVADMLSGEEVAETPVPPKPDVPSADETATTEPSADATTSVETTGTEDADDSADDDTATSGTTQPAVVPPPSDATQRMFWEQVASQENIGKLVAGEISSFSIGGVSDNGTTANVGISANYKSGGSLSGTMVMRNYSGVWYFSSITSSGGGGTLAKTIPADYGVTSTLVNQAPSNQDIPKAILAGGYRTVTVNSVSAGSGTATLGITLSGGTSPRMSGQIVCISKVIGGTKYWFVTSFRRS